MKRAALLLATLAMTVTACGLKVPATIVSGSGPEAGAPVEGTDPLAGGETAEYVDGGGPATTTGVAGGTTGTTVKVDGRTLVFNSETEGVSRDTITLCAHVPITGAAPIPHDENRFGQFYFDYVNKELGGVYGRKVIFKAINDEYYPAGARAAMEKCARIGAYIYIGVAGTDQIVSVAKWAERKRVPYFHGPTSVKDLKGFKYNVHVGPSYEYQHELLADFLVKRFGKDKKFGMIRVNSPYFTAGHDAFVARLKKHGVSLLVDRQVQKDERQFQDIYFELQQKGVEIVNNFTTPTIWINMLNQKPATYDPWWTAVAPVAGFNIVAAALGRGAKAVVFHNFNPACDCQTYSDEEMAQHKDLPWYDDIQKFRAIFKKYSPQKEPPADDFDYASYLGARGFHRLLLAVGPQPTRTKLFKLLETYKEPAAKTFPGCAGDFTRNGERMGAWRVNIFELKVGVWHQDHPRNSCVDRA